MRIKKNEKTINLGVIVAIWTVSEEEPARLFGDLLSFLLLLLLSVSLVLFFFLLPVNECEYRSA